MKSAGWRSAWLFANLILGFVPSALFFIWVERNLALPFLPIELGWPWISLSNSDLVWICLFDSLLIFAFGFIHSMLAQPQSAKFLSGIIPAPAFRSFYIAITGLSLFLVMALWQHTGVVLWTLPLSFPPLTAISLLVYWTLMGAAIWFLARFDWIQFAGFRQLMTGSEGQSVGTPRLITTGAYAWVRHPAYAATLSAFLITPYMTLDRMILTLVMALYLVAATPIEERKLVATFGDAYIQYSSQVPALIPIFRKYSKKA